MPQRNPSYYMLIILLILIVINLFALNLKVFLSQDTLTFSQTSEPISINQASPTSPSSQICPNSCLDLIEQATLSSQTAVSAPVIRYQTPRTQSHEFFIPLGTGSTSHSSWENIVATETIIDPSSYGSIKEATIIYSLRNPTKNGQIEAQLYNVSDNHPVWNSHVTMKGETEQTITSGQITFSSGAKLYRVQIKSSLSYPAYLDGAKIRIVVN